jgi:hypothetical protein
MAATERAHALTKWQMDIKAYPFGGIALGETLTNGVFP